MINPTFIQRFILVLGMLSLAGCLGTSTTTSFASATSPSGAKINVTSDTNMVSVTENAGKGTVIKCGSRSFTVTTDQVQFSGNIFCPLPEGVKTIDFKLESDSLTIVADGETIWEE